MKSLAIVAVVVVFSAFLGGPITFLLSRATPRSRALFLLHRIFTTLLGLFSILMGFTLAAAHVPIFMRLLAAATSFIAALGIFRLYKKGMKNWR